MIRRAGFGMIALVVTLTILALLLGTITAQLVLTRKTLAGRENQLQALWLARAGLEVAAAKLLAEPDEYRGEKLRLLPDGAVRVAVRRDGDTLHVTSEATYLAETVNPVVRAVTRTYRRQTAAAGIRLEVLPETIRHERE